MARAREVRREQLIIWMMHLWENLVVKSQILGHERSNMESRKKQVTRKGRMVMNLMMR